MNTCFLLMPDRNVSASPLMLKHTSCLCWFWSDWLRTPWPWAVVTHVSPTALTFVVNRLRFGSSVSAWVGYGLCHKNSGRVIPPLVIHTSALCVIPSLFRILLWRHQWLEQRNNNCWRMGSSEFHSRSLGKLNKPYMHLLWLRFLKLYV